MPTEKNFENRIKAFLKEEGCYPFGTPKDKMPIPPCGYYEKRWGGGTYTKSGLPDMHITICGRSIELEVKAPNGKPSELQLHNLKQIDEAGGFGVLLYPDEFALFKNFILCLKVNDPNMFINYNLLKRRWKHD